jgi:hypothetical protein
MRHCPECHSARLRRSKRRGLIERHLLSVVALKPFRCESCLHRFFRWPGRGQEANAFTPAERPTLEFGS